MLPNLLYPEARKGIFPDCGNYQNYLVNFSQVVALFEKSCL